MTSQLEIGDTLYTKNDLGMLVYVGNDTADVYLLSNNRNMIKSKTATPISAAQIARWLELKNRDGSIAHMDARP